VSDIDEVLDYWFGGDPKAQQKKWFNGGPAVDAEISSKFAALVEQARAGQLDAWGSSPRGALAWLILVDQFSRNLYRDQAEAFSCDPKALAWARAHLAQFEALPAVERMFTLLPFEHAEDLEAQKQGVALMVQVALDAGAPDDLKIAVDYGRKHLDVIARFGRFPHRNAVLGRASTPDEQTYLAYGKLTKQWL
jgi:uncharacterized protein (DUF924 family)